MNKADCENLSPNPRFVLYDQIQYNIIKKIVVEKQLFLFTGSMKLIKNKSITDRSVILMDFTNFRDLGGLAGAEGKKVKEKAILRAGEPVGLSATVISELIDIYKLAHIIDFRGEVEVTKSPVDHIEGADYLNIDILSSHLKTAPSLDEMLENLKPGIAEEFMCDVYQELVLSPGARAGYRQFIDALLNPKGSLLFHCFAGKDRTGWGAVIILKILGVSAEDILTDYLATIESRKSANAKLIEMHREKGLNQEQLDIFEALMSVKESYLESAFNSVEKEYGSFDDYLKQGLNVEDEEIDKLRNLYLI